MWSAYVTTFPVWLIGWKIFSSSFFGQSLWSSWIISSTVIVNKYVILAVYLMIFTNTVDCISCTKTFIWTWLCTTQCFILTSYWTVHNTITNINVRKAFFISWTPKKSGTGIINALFLIFSIWAVQLSITCVPDRNAIGGQALKVEWTFKLGTIKQIFLKAVRPGTWVHSG